MTQYLLSSARAGEVPYLLLAAKDSPADAPLVLVLHGLGGDKEKILPTLYRFAQYGFRVVAPDARQHGERDDRPGREERLQSSYIAALYDIITGTAEDVSTLLDHFGVCRAGIHGISLGGYVTFRALLSEPRLTCASVAMGSPDWLGPLRALGVDLRQPAYAPLVRTHPLDQAEHSYHPRALLMLHGEEDDVVPVTGVEALYTRLKPLYAAEPERLALVRYPALGHVYTQDMTDRSIDWLGRFR